LVPASYCWFGLDADNSINFPACFDYEKARNTSDVKTLCRDGVFIHVQLS
jgi:hypothetical protein